MADWYVSATAHAAVPVFAISTGYTVGQFVRRITLTVKANWVMRCTVAGTSAAAEPTWPTADNGTVVSGGATFTNVTGQSTYGWSAAAGDIPTLLGAIGTNRFVGGDRMFVSSDHTETQGAGTTYGVNPGATGVACQVLSVNRAGSVPPVPADLTAGASVTVNAGTMLIEATIGVYHYGMNYIYTGTATGISFNSSGLKSHYMEACQLYLNTATTTVKIQNGSPASLILSNSTLRFGSTSQAVWSGSGTFEIVWLNTPSAIAGATFPASLFAPAGTQNLVVTARGVDLSAITGILVNGGTSSAAGSKYLFDSCRIASAATRYSGASAINTRDVVELVNCYNGTSFLSESYQPVGAVTPEFTITLTGGAADDVGAFSHKMVSTAGVDKYVQPLVGFWLDLGYATTGASKTATVEIISSTALNNDEISLLLEYQGTASSSVASFATSLPATVLTTASAVTTSTATWNSSPATPQKQRLQVTFTPRVAGRVRGLVRLGKVSATVYYNPQVTIT